MQIKNIVIVVLINIIASNAIALASCSVSVPTVNFGNFNMGSSRTAMVTASVTCSGIGLLVNYTVRFSTGTAGAYNPRQMASGANRLNYNLYKNAAFTQILGNGTSSTVTITDSYLISLGPVTRNYTIFASLPSQSPAFAGTYQDTITATVTQP
ncbi:MAG TPA: spore coat U domain-containing protein [Rickettsia endosymbiont of Omalisus fontisbellaquei]|nr:spore coat U domain-containing protein [Rickettsia endosymbiont of Omalisus fontisbellaquei]